MSDIEIHSKTDRELLIMIVGRVNTVCEQVEKISEWKEGNGLPGAQFQLRVIWLCFVAILAKIWNNR